MCGLSGKFSLGGKNPIIARIFSDLTGSLAEEKSLKDFVREILEGISQFSLNPEL